VTSRSIETETAAAAAHARKLLSAAAVRERAGRLFDAALAGDLPDWRLDVDRLAPTADFVAGVVRDRYPRLEVPVHARWRHFEFGGRDLWRELASRAAWPDRDAAARAAFDLAITSVLLDAGAGPDWRFHDASTGLTAARSEGLALASLRWFASGGFSDIPGDPYRTDAAALERIDTSSITAALQVHARNPLIGLEGRAGLLNRLGAQVRRRPDLFASADAPRPGGLFDALRARATAGRLPAALILETLLDGLGPIWEGRPTLGGVALGDCWPYPFLAGPSPAAGYVPLHKLSQWLSYSLIEPLERAGILVTDVDGLTGLAEYRNGGLFVDMGVLAPREGTALSHTHGVGDPLVVGWRGLTVALLDRLAPLVRARLGVAAGDFPLARVLEGGTWTAGRLIARRLRDGGPPPLLISSDGTVF
jgi:hypothetical protein